MATKVAVYVTSVTDITAVGGVAWTNPNNVIGAPDDAYATVHPPSSDNDLRSKLQMSFDLSSLPDGATITGFILSIWLGSADAVETGQDTYWADVQLGIGAVPTYSDKKVGASFDDTPPAIQTETSVVMRRWGECCDLWGLTPSVADLKLNCIATIATWDWFGSGYTYPAVDAAELSVCYEDAPQPPLAYHYNRRRRP